MKGFFAKNSKFLKNIQLREVNLITLRHKLYLTDEFGKIFGMLIEIYNEIKYF